MIALDIKDKSTLGSVLWEGKVTDLVGTEYEEGMDPVLLKAFADAEIHTEVIVTDRPGKWSRKYMVTKRSCAILKK